MASIIKIDTGRSGYADVVRWVRDHGRVRSPRNIKTYDAGHVDVVVRRPYDALPLDVGRKLNAAIAAAEAAQLIAGRARHDVLPRISPKFTRYAEPDGRFHGAYGDRVGDQVDAVVRKLTDDPDTRQAVVTLWNPALDNQVYRRDYPCTVALNFAIVDDVLELRTLMRSNDVWLGFPHDVFQFTQLQLTVARALNVEPGRYTHTAWSLHIYADDVERVDELRTPEVDENAASYQPVGFGDVGTAWRICREHALVAIDGTWNTSRSPVMKLTESERWYVDKLAPFVAPRSPQLG